MKLTIGENIRTLRRAKDMTQEQLADMLGVTYQSVSRWENSQAYPDIELIPAIAGIFETTTDNLLGMSDKERRNRALEMINDFCIATHESPKDFEKLTAMLREIRSSRIPEHIWRLWYDMDNSALWAKELLPEYRLLAKQALEHNPKDSVTISTMAAIEDDEALDEFLRKYSHGVDISMNNLLLKRYQRRRELDKYEPLKQFKLFDNVDEILSSYVDSRKPADPAEHLKSNTFALNTLHAYCNDTPDAAHPISADGEVDFWVGARIQLGYQRACYLASTGDKEGAFTVLEDVVSLLEKVMKITTPTELRCSSPWATDLVFTAEETWGRLYNDVTRDEERAIYIYIETNSLTTSYMVYPSHSLNALTAPQGWEWFDPIRNDPRYQGYVDRVRALVVTRPAKG